MLRPLVPGSGLTPEPRAELWELLWEGKGARASGRDPGPRGALDGGCHLRVSGLPLVGSLVQRSAWNSSLFSFQADCGHKPQPHCLPEAFPKWDGFEQGPLSPQHPQVCSSLARIFSYSPEKPASLALQPWGLGADRQFLVTRQPLIFHNQQVQCHT